MSIPCLSWGLADNLSLIKSFLAVTNPHSTYSQSWQWAWSCMELLCRHAHSYSSSSLRPFFHSVQCEAEWAETSSIAMVSILCYVSNLSCTHSSSLVSCTLRKFRSHPLSGGLRYYQHILHYPEIIPGKSMSSAQSLGPDTFWTNLKTNSCASKDRESHQSMDSFSSSISPGKKFFYTTTRSLHKLFSTFKTLSCC